MKEWCRIFWGFVRQNTHCLFRLTHQSVTSIEESRLLITCSCGKVFYDQEYAEEEC